MLWCGAASCNLLEGLRMINVCRSTAQYMTMVAELNSLCEAKDTTENTTNAEIILFIAEHCFVTSVVFLEPHYLGVSCWVMLQVASAGEGTAQARCSKPRHSVGDKGTTLRST